ncbi:hypothetical protein EYF80_052211 [Liparis tanakae]|uniref:Uncharacterized protein n=1 Tax=Liparis tanakae TaxID=230148 RepID=A0A4Z2FA31_9TELE|nr:hypothetical protein EYF80_052211 [Liparis tanakae]
MAPTRPPAFTVTLITRGRGGAEVGGAAAARGGSLEEEEAFMLPTCEGRAACVRSDLESAASGERGAGAGLTPPASGRLT